jgi:integrase
MQNLRIPSYRHHKPSGQAVVTLGGKDFYLGKHNTAASRAEYKRRIAEWTASRGTIAAPASDIAVAEVLAAVLRHAKSHYVRPDGSQTSELGLFKLTIKPVNDLYGTVSVTNFGPLALKAVRQRFIDAGWSRKVVNGGVNRVRHIFKWGVAEQLVPPSVMQALQAVAGLQYGRSEARETEPVKPVPDAFVDAVLPHVSRQVAAMIQLQRVTGMRSGEVAIMRCCDINMNGRVWVFTPALHKTSWRGQTRQVYLGPKAQAIIRPFLKADLEAYLFSPDDAETERNDQLFGKVSPNRKTRVYPCELRARERRRRARKGRELNERYNTDTYRRAVERGIEAENQARLIAAAEKGAEPDDVELVPHWHPHQLRHNAATFLRREHGIEVARIILGHRSPAITEVYAEVDHTRALAVMAEVG